MQRSGRLLLGVVTLAAGLGLCAAVAAVVAVARLTEPASVSIGPPPEALTGARPVDIPSASGSTLKGWWIAGGQGAGAVVLMHGVRSNRLSLVERARALSARGHAVLLFDFQAHGESPGACVTFGALEAFDAEAAVRFVRQAAPDERIGAVGQSLGGAAALLGPRPLPVDALVIEAVYPDIATAIANRISSRLGAPVGPFVVDLLGPVWRAALKQFCGIDASMLRPADRIEGATAPILIASGELDDRTNIADAREMFSRAREPKAFWEVAGAGHVDLERFSPDAYWSRVSPFLAERVRAAAR